MSRPVGIPHAEDGRVGRRLRAVPVVDAILDELAAEVVGWPVGAPVRGDPIIRQETPRESGGDLAKLTAALIVAGSWGCGTRVRGASSRRARGPLAR